MIVPSINWGSDSRDAECALLDTIFAQVARTHKIPKNKFETIYNELKYYSAFNANPGTPEEAVRSINCFFTEIKEDYIFEKDCSEKRFEFLLMSYRHAAIQYIINWQTDTNSFKKFLKSVYAKVNVDYLNETITEDELAAS